MYTISEVAERSGFSASALRYYEGIGLVEPAGRTPSGYRMYDDHALARLAFIGRAKQLGCTLEEITDLVGIWDGERCGPVQRRFHELVTDKILQATGQVAELTAFTNQLRAAAGQLSQEPVDGPCDEACACVDAFRPQSIAVAVACTLRPDELPDRLTNWQSILSHARSRAWTADGALRVEFDGGIDLGDLTRLAAAEQDCCSFFSFAITVDSRGVALEVRAPDGAADVVGSLFGQPA